MYILEPILKLNWKNTEKMDAKRIASQTEPDGLVKILDVPYIDDGEKGHLLDIYYPEGTTEKLPVIIDIHGGGWMYGYKEINKNFCLKLSEKGFLVASINYRLAGDVLFCDQVRDIFASLKFLSEELKKYPADLDNVFLAGDSAGGHFACVTTAVNMNEDMQKDFDVEYCGLNFKGVAAICPAVDLISPNIVMNITVPVLLGEKQKKSKYRKYLNMGNIVSEDFPPFYINTATNDFLKSQCYKLKDWLQEKGVEYHFHDFKDKYDGKYLTHVFNVIDPFTPWGDQANTEIADFFKSKMKTEVK